MRQHPNFIRTRWEQIVGTTGFFFLLLGVEGAFYHPGRWWVQPAVNIGLALCAVAQFFLSPRGRQMETRYVDISEGGRLAELKNEPKGPNSPHSNGEVQRNTLLIFLPPGLGFLIMAFCLHQPLGYWLLGIPGVGLTMGAFWPLIKRGMGEKLRQYRPPASSPTST